MKRLFSVLLIFSLLISGSMTVLAEADAGENLKGEEALAYYTEHLEDPDMDAYEKIGTLYREGLDGIPRNYQTAIEWYQKGIDAGKVPSVTGLGYMYLHGFGIVRDYEKALELFQQAAEQNNAYAMFLIGSMYEYGLSVEKEDNKALEWYQKAADAGYAEGELKIGQYYIYVAGEEEKGLALYNEAAEKGIAKAYWYLGDFYWGVQNYWEAEEAVTAKTYYDQGAALGDPDCMCRVGYLFDIGAGTQKSYTQSVEWLTKASEAGQREAMVFLADKYYYGEFGIAKPDRAQRLYTEAGARGEPYSLRKIAYSFHAKPATGYDSSKDEVTRVLELYGKALVCFRDEDNKRENGWFYFNGSVWDTAEFQEYIDGMVVNHVCTREQSDSIINEQVENFRLDFAKEN